MIYKYILACWYLSHSLECKMFTGYTLGIRALEGRKGSRIEHRVKPSYFAGLTSANTTGSSGSKMSSWTRPHWTQNGWAWTLTCLLVDNYIWVTSPWKVDLEWGGSLELKWYWKRCQRKLAWQQDSLQASGNTLFLDGGLCGTLLCSSLQFLRGLSVGGDDLGNDAFLEEMKLKLERWIGRSWVKKGGNKIPDKTKVYLNFSQRMLYIKGIQSIWV